MEGEVGCSASFVDVVIQGLHVQCDVTLLSCSMLCLFPPREGCASDRLSPEGAQACVPAGFYLHLPLVCTCIGCKANPIHVGEGAGSVFIFVLSGIAAPIHGVTPA